MAPEGFIPTNAGDLPIEQVVLDDDVAYPVELEKVTLSLKTDKNGLLFCALQVAVIEGDYEGSRLMRNYLRLPVPIYADMRKKDRIAAQNNSADFGRFCRAFKIKGQVRYVTDVRDESEREAFTEWMSANIGNTGQVTVDNSEWQGRMRSAIKDFVL